MAAQSPSRQQERRDTAVGFLSLLGVMAAHSVMETARDALFLSQLPAKHLPWAYLALAGLAVLAARGNRILLRTFHDKRQVLSTTLVVATAVTASFAFPLSAGRAWAAYSFYVWTGLLATVVVVQLWLLLENVVTVTQAKRVFGFVAAGGVLGATLGALLAERLVQYVPAYGLVLLAAALLLLSSGSPFLWGRQRLQEAPPRRPRPEQPGRHSSAFRELCSEPYLRLLFMLVVVSTVALTGVDYVFKSVVAEQVETERLGSFFARFYFILNGIALFVQLVFSSWLLATIGVNRALLVLPLLLIAAGGSFFVLPALIAAGLFKGADGSLRHSVHRTGVEILYLPVPREVRERYKTVIDGVGGRGGQAMASLAILGTVALGWEPVPLVGGIAVLALAWLGLLAGIKRHYVDLFRYNLREGTIETRVDLAQLDLHSLEALISALSSERDEEVLTALELFERHDKTSLIPVLILYHPSKAVVLRALDIFTDAGRQDFPSVARRLLRHDDEEIRAAALRALTAVEPDEDLLREALGDDSNLVYATALVGLLSHGFGHPDRLRAALDRCVREGTPGTRAALAHAIVRERDRGFVPTLLRMADAPESTVRLAVAQAMAEVPDPRFLSKLLSMLAHGRLRSTARRAIVAVGPSALSFVDEALWDGTVPRKVRRHLPRTISRFEPRNAAAVLLRHLAHEEDGAVRYKILRGLGRLRADHPDLPLDRSMLKELLHGTLERAIQFLDWRLATERAQQNKESLCTAGGELLIAVLHEKEDSALERTFRLLALLHKGEDFELLWHGLQSEEPRVRAASREVLAHVVSGSERRTLLALVSEASDRERLQHASAAFGLKNARPSYQQRLAAMLRDRSEAVRSIAAYHIGELGLQDLAEPLRQAKSDGSRYLAEVLDRALTALEHGEPESVHDVA